MPLYIYIYICVCVCVYVCACVCVCIYILKTRHLFLDKLYFYISVSSKPWKIKSSTVW